MAVSIERTLVLSSKSNLIRHSDSITPHHQLRIVDGGSNKLSSTGNHSIRLGAVNDDLRVIHEMRLGEFKQGLADVRRKDSLEGLVMVDALQRLAIDYQFENEIEAILGVERSISPARGDHYEQALRFRLLRQEGYDASSDIFEKFGLDFLGGAATRRQLGREDILRLTSLYEATHLCTEGEDVLQRIGEITGRLLNTSLNKIIDREQAKFVKNTLRHPFHKSLPRFTSNDSMNGHPSWSNYKWNDALLELTLADSDMMKTVYQSEVMQVTKWWKDLGLGKELKFARDQPLKWYMWAAGIIDDPRLSDERLELTKAISLVYVIDDVFDVYGTLEELVLFANSVFRWSPDENLPDCTRICFHALNDITNEISDKVYRRHGWNPVTSLRKSWGRLAEAFLIEARWFASRKSLATEEYLRNAVISSGMHVVLVNVFFLLGKGITDQNIDVLDSVPGIVSSPATILRLWDDLGSARDENQDGHDGSFLEYYKQEHPGRSDVHARDHVKDLITKEWKKLNEECLLPREFPKPFCKACLNAARMVPLMYDYKDDRSLSLLEKHMNSLLFEEPHFQASTVDNIYKLI